MQNVYECYKSMKKFGDNLFGVAIKYVKIVM